MLLMPQPKRLSRGWNGEPSVRLNKSVMYALAITLSIGCRETFARVVGAGVVTSYQGCATEPMLPVGDSMQFVARVARSSPQALSFNPLNGVILYTSVTNPVAFDWTVVPQGPNDPRAGLEGPGEARVTPSGVLIADAPGYVFVYARSAGSAGFSRYLVVPRVLRMAVTPHDTAIRVGDTVTVRLDAEMETELTGRYVVWNLVGQGSGSEVASAANDPDAYRSSHTRRFVAVRPGTAEIEICVAGTWRDTTVLRVAPR